MSDVSAVTKLSLLVYMPESLTWQSDILTFLQNHPRFFIRIVQSQEDILSQNDYDTALIICFDTPNSVLLLQSLSQHQSTHRVIIASETKKITEAYLLGCADVVLAPDKKVIEKHLLWYWGMQQKALLAAQEKKALVEELERLKQEIARYQRSSGEMEILKNAIVQNVSHELKTPLLQVKSAVALLAEDIQDSRLIQYATEATARLETIVRNITMLGSSFDIHIGLVIVRDAVEYARRNLGRIWLHRNEAARIKIELEDNLPPVRADKQGLSTVLQLLMDNALKFSEKEIYVLAKQEGDFVTIIVRDQGIGIAKAELEKIFESFYQVDNSSTRRFGGVGIGLALVKLILDHHGVTISVKSEVGKGSQFYFQLPAVKIQHPLG